VTVLVAPRLVEFRARWQTESLGEFFCPGCGGDRNYRRQHGRRWLRLLNVPLLPLSGMRTSVQCTACGGRRPPQALEQPTTGRLSELLRTAQYTIVLAVLAAGGTSRPTRAAAVAAVHEIGYPELDEPRILAALAAVTTEDVDLGELGELYGCGSGLAVEIHTALEPLAEHLEDAGRVRVLTQGALVALADGPYRSTERELLLAVGRLLRLNRAAVEVTLAAATRQHHP
jgi:Tellurite resistance protein TerB